jgi:transposase-like protein
MRTITKVIKDNDVDVKILEPGILKSFDWSKVETVEIKCPECGGERVAPMATGENYSEWVCCHCGENFKMEYWGLA